MQAFPHWRAASFLTATSGDTLPAPQQFSGDYFQGGVAVGAQFHGISILLYFYHSPPHQPIPIMFVGVGWIGFLKEEIWRAGQNDAYRHTHIVAERSTLVNRFYPTIHITVS